MNEVHRLPSGLDGGWLLKLRWGTVVCQLIVLVCCERLLALAVNWRLVAPPMVALVVSNLVGEWWWRRRRVFDPLVLFATLAVDVVLFSLLLFHTGGPANPFSFLYLIYLAVGAVVLGGRASWALAALAFTLLGVIYLASDEPAHHQHLSLHLKGMWVAFGVASAFIVYFVGRVSSALVARDMQLAKTQRLAALATLAAGAAHELSTPLSTIAVVARELERQAQAPEVREDAALVRREIERCRGILTQLSVDAGVVRGETLTLIAAFEIVDDVVRELGATERVTIDAPSDATVWGPRRALVQALKNVVDNSLRASSTAEPVRVKAVRHSDTVELRVEDHGLGIDPALASRVGEPFFSTRPHGTGMGLGLFVARAVVEQAGGRLVLESQVGEGTQVSMWLPATIRRTHVGVGAK